jgi:hypothetical protein
VHLLSQACLFIYCSHGKWVFPHLLWSFPPTTTFTSFPSPGCWVGATAPVFSCQLVYLQFLEGLPLPPSVLRSPCPLCYMSFLLLLFSFSFFPGWGSVCPRSYADLAQDCLWEYHVPLSSPCGLRLPKWSGSWHLAVVQEPSWFFHITWSGNATHRLGVWRSQSFASSRCFFL